MNSTILNKRKKWISDIEKKELDNWTKAAEKLTDFKDYFGIKREEDCYNKDTDKNNSYFKKSLALFKTVFSLQKDGKADGLPKLDISDNYDALITIVGFSPEPLLHTILTLAPNAVYTIVTKESAASYDVPNIHSDSKIQLFEEIIQLYKELSQDIIIKPIHREVQSIGAIDTFKRVREIIQEIKKEKKNAKIAIDITGGKKSADASAFLTAAIEKDIDIFYVDFEEYKENKPCCGTEFLNKLENPYDLYNIDLVAQAKDLFRKHNYASAKSLFEEVERKLEHKAEQFNLKPELEEIKKMKKKAEFYRLWDAFEYKEANKIEENALLKNLIPKKENAKIYEQEKQYEYVKNIVLDRFANAERREEQGRYEDAMTRYAQALEIALKSKMIELIETHDLKPKSSKETDIKKTWKDLEMDRTEISRVYDWLLMGEKLKRKKDDEEYIFQALESKSLKDNFIKIFGLKEDISNNEYEKKATSYKKIINHRNDFIHVSTLSGKKEKMQQFKDFSEKMLKVVYGNFDYSAYKFPSEL